MTRRLLSIGECMVEMAPTSEGTYQLGFAGDTLNTAWYARQAMGPDWEVAYLTAVGQDAVSGRMTDFIRQAGIETDFIRDLPDCTVGLYLIQLDKGERSFAYWRSASAARRIAADAAWLEAACASADILFFSGITLAILTPDDRTEFLRAMAKARTNGATVAFDPNLRPRLWETPDTMRSAIMAAAAVSDIVLPSFEDDAAAFADATPEATARRYAAQGVRLVVTKNGADEMLCLSDGAISTFTPPAVAEVVDTTAAGDSFNAGFLASYLDAGDLDTALRAGAALAAKVIGKRGALVSLE